MQRQDDAEAPKWFRGGCRVARPVLWPEKDIRTVLDCCYPVSNGGAFSLDSWFSLIVAVLLIGKRRMPSAYFRMEKLIALTIISAILIFAGTYVLSVTRSDRGRR